MVPLIKQKPCCSSHTSWSSTFQKLNQSQQLATASGISLLFPFPAPFMFSVNSSLKTLPQDHWSHPQTLAVRKEHVWWELWNVTSKSSNVEISVFWNALTFCPAKHHFFFLKSCHDRHSYMNLIFKRKGKKGMAQDRSIARRAVLQTAVTNSKGIFFFLLDKHRGPLW